MKAWQYSSTTGGLEKNLTLVNDFPDISDTPISEDQVLIKVIAASINPADFKIPEMGPIGRAMVGGTPAIPAIDFAGIVHAVPDHSPLKVGQRVFGRLNGPKRIGTLGEYTIAPLNGTAPLPDEVTMEQAAGYGTAALTSYLALGPYLKSGNKVFINGGSGGTGTFGIQIAKALGAHVTVTCSTANVGLVKELGADEVIDYKQNDVVATLSEGGTTYDHVVDNIGDGKLYKSCEKYTKPGARYVQIGASTSGKSILELASNSLLPSFLGGGKRPFKFLTVSNDVAGFKRLAEWAKSGEVKTVIDETFEFDDVPKAFAKLKEGRTKGKIVIHVAKE